MPPKRPVVKKRSGKGLRKRVTRSAAKIFSSRSAALLLIGAAVIAALALANRGGSAAVTPSPSGKPALEQGGLWQSAVQVAWQTKDATGSLSYCRGGSGGLVAEIDQVLTNEHVVNDSGNTGVCADAKLYVGYPVEPTGVYFVWWPARVRGSNAFLDLALVDVELTADPIAEESLYPASIVFTHEWPVYTVASAAPALGDPISIYSYPAIGGYSMTFTAGHVAGWSRDYWTRSEASNRSAAWGAAFALDADGYREYMKLDATLAHGSSGSSVLNASGEIIGVSTLVGVGEQTTTVDCAHLADTNGDGATDERDSCIPVGGFLNAAATLTDIRAFLTDQGLRLQP
jgi:hypothetical protein